MDSNNHTFNPIEKYIIFVHLEVKQAVIFTRTDVRILLRLFGIPEYITFRACFHKA